MCADLGWSGRIDLRALLEAGANIIVTAPRETYGVAQRLVPSGARYDLAALAGA
jgi:hypothetical protein